MFELPEAKRVRREDLNKSDESDWSDGGDVDADLEARLNAQIAKSLGLDEDSYRPLPQSQAADTKATAKSQEPPISDRENEPEAAPDDEPEDAGYAFRLFSSAGPAPKVVLEDDTVVQEGGLVRGRPLSYYLATDVSTAQKQEYENAAVSGEDVIARSRLRSWGLELPWKVTRITVTRRARPGESFNNDEMEVEMEDKKRRRPGKKRRIAMRVKARAKVKAEEETKKKVADKEEQLKEKKKRMNRLKKLRKRAKKKQGAQGDGDGAGDAGDSSSAEE